ncbi:MAG: transcription/translation regulatory transformer protein RfaH [Nitrospirae bacterium]|nr:transcription/translation regulatory transformer protein RfaH [Nitrospirota bacterium]
MHWYAVNTKPRQEKLAELSLQRLGVETFSPRLKQNRLIRKRRQTVIRPLFPGYLFARFNLDNHYRTVNYAQGVRRIVTFGSAPTTVDEEMIESIKSRLLDGCVTVQTPSFSAGQTVRVQSGPFQGLEAIFEREMGDQQRVVLLLQTLSYQARVVVALEQLVQC